MSMSVLNQTHHKRDFQRDTSQNVVREKKQAECKRVKDGQDKEEGKKEEKARGQGSKASFSTAAVKAFEKVAKA